MSTTPKVCPTCGVQYPATARFCETDGTPLRSSEGSTDLVGMIIADRYHVLKMLGKGGMGQVYLVEHVKMGRKDALKVMHPSMVRDLDSISRFNREAANASRIIHPNVAMVYDFGETSQGLVYLAMEYVEGPTLGAILERSGALAPARAAEIIRQTAEALAVAHEKGIVHRDLKPDNIMIAAGRNGADWVKVVDFGIAKTAGNELQKVTKTGLVVGSPDYMSPEQAAGEQVDGRSDIYSLALVAFNMLTGRLPFVGDSPREAITARLVSRPSSLAAMKPDVSWPDEVQAVIDVALQGDPKRRYQTATDFALALSAAVSRMPAGAGTATASTSAYAVGASTTDEVAPTARIDRRVVTEVMSGAPTRQATPQDATPQDAAPKEAIAEAAAIQELATEAATVETPRPPGKKQSSPSATMVEFDRFFGHMSAEPDEKEFAALFPIAPPVDPVPVVVLPAASPPAPKEAPAHVPPPVEQFSAVEPLQVESLHVEPREAEPPLVSSPGPGSVTSWQNPAPYAAAPTPLEPASNEPARDARADSAGFRENAPVAEASPSATKRNGKRTTIVGSALAAAAAIILVYHFTHAPSSQAPSSAGDRQQEGVAPVAAAPDSTRFVATRESVLAVQRADSTAQMHRDSTQLALLKSKDARDSAKAANKKRDSLVAVRQHLQLAEMARADSATRIATDAARKSDAVAKADSLRRDSVQRADANRRQEFLARADSIHRDSVQRAESARLDAARSAQMQAAQTQPVAPPPVSHAGEQAATAAAGDFVAMVRSPGGDHTNLTVSPDVSAILKGNPKIVSSQIGAASGDAMSAHADVTLTLEHFVAFSGKKTTTYVFRALVNFSGGKWGVARIDVVK